jgi:alpha-beta hydrolase superfamily lysophospholipase
MDRRSWFGLLPKIKAAGLTVMALDFRGIGDSQAGEFESDAFSHFPDDTRAALSHFRSYLAPRARVAIVGASCGANQAFLAAPHHSEIKALVILSGRLSQSDTAWSALAGRSAIAVLGIAAKDDGQTVSQAARAVATSTSPHSKLLAYEGALHGVPLFEQDPGLPETIVQWLSARLAK